MVDEEEKLVCPNCGSGLFAQIKGHSITKSGLIQTGTSIPRLVRCVNCLLLLRYDRERQELICEPLPRYNSYLFATNIH